MIRTIFVPLEISNSDDAVVKYAIEIAQQFDSHLVFFQSYSMTEYAYPSGGMASMTPPVPEFVKEKGELRREKLNYLVRNFTELTNMEFELVIDTGAALDLVPDTAAQTKADLIVIGANGASGMEELFGTIAERLTRLAPCPVLVIPDDFEYRPMRKIGMAVDVDNLENDLHLSILFDIAKKFQTTLDIVNVSEDIDKADMRHNKIYQRMKKEFDSNVNYFTISILLKDDEEKALSEYIDKNHIDLLGLVYREHGFFKRVFNAGLRKKLVFHTHIPLLILK